jgi:hypothetical protein
MNTSELITLIDQGRKHLFVENLLKTELPINIDLITYYVIDRRHHHDVLPFLELYKKRQSIRDKIDTLLNIDYKSDTFNRDTIINDIYDILDCYKLLKIKITIDHVMNFYRLLLNVFQFYYYTDFCKEFIDKVHKNGLKFYDDMVYRILVDDSRILDERCISIAEYLITKYDYKVDSKVLDLIDNVNFRFRRELESVIKNHNLIS